jgi:hypothetical protein
MLESLAQAAGAAAEGAPGDGARERHRVARELQARILTLYRAIGGVTATPTADQRSQLEYFRSFLKLFETRLRAAA